MSKEMQIDIIIDLLTEFDEMGFIPSTTVPNPEAYAIKWREMLTHALIEYRKQSEGEWISVSKRLPDQELRELTSKNPLMTFRCMTTRKSDYHDGLIYVYQAFYDERGFINENGVNITESVTHWSHLPEPPYTKGGAE